MTTLVRQLQTHQKNGGRVAFWSKYRISSHTTAIFLTPRDAQGFADSYAIYKIKIASAVREKSAIQWARDPEMKKWVGHLWWHHNGRRITKTKSTSSKTYVSKVSAQNLNFQLLTLADLDLAM